MTYRIKILPETKKEIDQLPGHMRQRVRQFIAELARNPRPNEAKALREREDIWRYRVGEWRVVWQILDEELVVLIIRVGKKHGPEFYLALFD